jgi:LPS export ABC transporter protein LptC
MLSVNSINKIFFALGIACLIGVACNDKTAVKPVGATGPRKLLPEEATDLVSLLSEPVKDSVGNLGARVKGKLTAPYMLRYDRTDSPYAEFPRTLHVDFYNDTIKTESQLDARYGKYYQNQEKVFLRDSVVVKNLVKRDTLHCKQLWWDQHTERFYTDDSVQINTPDKTLYGTGMEADQNFRWYSIKKLTGNIQSAGSNLPK